ncbi:hypothetical protein [Bacillus sp. UMB0893]|uniref:hypothetical protein n=1 Tax=Bacillus sp. UMB0893 TaxID=2066053 RepID=UPI000C775B7D|nr:hypothetical protein [Bacillus sp. UMB0893]PLR65976.1 hypothetical protein CYJ36_20085 [Bacillus sp. UMB0893]
MSFAIMLTQKKSDIHGNLDIVVQAMDFSRGGMWQVPLKRLDDETFPEELRQLITDNLEKIKSGKWDYTGRYK